MKLIKAEKRERGFYFKVLVNQAEPDEANRVYEEFTWGVRPPDGQTQAQYLASIMREMKLLLKGKYGNKQSLTLTQEGEEF